VCIAPLAEAQLSYIHPSGRVNNLIILYNLQARRCTSTLYRSIGDYFRVIFRRKIAKRIKLYTVLRIISVLELLCWTDDRLIYTRIMQAFKCKAFTHFTWFWIMSVMKRFDRFEKRLKQYTHCGTCIWILCIICRALKAYRNIILLLICINSKRRRSTLGRHFLRQINDRNNKPGRKSGGVIDERFLNWLTSPINLTICQRHAHALIAVRDVASSAPLQPPISV
jgi:hypothetical protein